MDLSSSNIIMQLLWQSDFVTKMVLGVLFVMSVMCWAIFFYKLCLFKIKQRQMISALRYIKKVQSVDDLRTMAASFSQTLPGYLVIKSITVVKGLQDVKDSPLSFNEHDVETFSQRIEHTIEEIVVQEEAYIPLLSSIATVSPLLGLFGTIWGLIHSFMSISQAQQADIVTVAPGIAEALITTLVGLLVAIPALLMAHYFMAKVRTIEQQVIRLANELSWIVQTVFAH